MYRWIPAVLAGPVYLATALPAVAGTVTGTIHSVEGHLSPACRVLVLRRDADQSLAYFRVPDTGTDNSILAVAMMAFSLNRKVTVAFSDTTTTGCGTKPRVEYVRMSRDT